MIESNSAHIKPFQCFLLSGGTSVIVNFGTVICPTTKSVNNIFVPTIEGSPLLRFKDEGFSERNLLSISGENVVISLKINFENIEDLVEEKTVLWESAALGGSEASFREIFNSSVNLELQQDIFNDFIDTTQSVDDIDFSSNEMLSYAMSNSLNPFVSFSPRVTSVSIVSESFTELSQEEVAAKYNFIQNEEGFYKLCPIAVINESILTQLINFDYIVAFPFYWLDSLKQPFRNVPE